MITGNQGRPFVETILLLLLLLLLLLSLYTVLSVFLGVFTFSAIFAVSCSGFFEKMVQVFGNRRKLAAVVYSILFIVIIASPFIYLISALAHHVREVYHWIDSAQTNGVPPLPGWMTTMPYVGEEVDLFWKGVQADPKEMIALHQAQLKPLLQRILHGGSGIIGVVIELLLGIIISAILLTSQQKVLAPVRQLTNHLFGTNDGPALLNTTAQAVRGVSIGVMGTAFIAGMFSWIGLAIAGIPFALAIAALVFFLVLIQVGPLLVWIPLVVWLFLHGQTGWGIFIIAWGVLLMVIDAVLKPLLIAKSGKLPFLVLFIGVIGGMVAWGFTGMFKGAIIMAVFYTVFNSWLERTKHANVEATAQMQ